MKHRKTELNKEDVEEDEDEEYGVERTVKKLDPREPSIEEREEHEKTHLPFRSWLVPTLREKGEARRRLAEKPRGIMRWRRCTWISFSCEMRARTGRWRWRRRGAEVW